MAPNKASLTVTLDLEACEVENIINALGYWSHDCDRKDRADVLRTLRVRGSEDGPA